MALHCCDEGFQTMRFHPLKTLIVGQNPTRHTIHNPLSADNKMWTGGRIARIAGMSVHEYNMAFSRVNVLPDYVGPFRVNAISRNAGRLLRKEILDNDLTCILLGNSVAECLGFLKDSTPNPRVPEIRRSSCFRCWIVPHPSGLNRQMNDPSVIEEFRRILIALA